MAWWVIAIVFIGGTVLYDLLRKKPKFDSPSPAGLGDFNFPTIGEGRVIPWVAGTVKVPGPLVTWYGDLKVVPITEKVKTGLFTSTTITKGYKYYLGIELVLCSGPIDRVDFLMFDDRYIPVSTVETPDRFEFTINQPDFFGGDEEEGGIKGDVYVYLGTATQNPDDYLEAKIGTDLPAYRHIARAVFRGVYLGTSPYLKPFALSLHRLPNGLGLTGGDHDIGKDANPAAMIYDIITRPHWQNGLGIPSGAVDVDNFRAVGAVLAAEGMGLSMIQDGQTTGEDMIIDILRHIDAVQYVEPDTGLITLKLIRDDYGDPTSLPVLDDSTGKLTGWTRPDWKKIPNAVRVSYVQRAVLDTPENRFSERTVQAQDIAAIDIQGGEVHYQDFDFRGFSNEANAQKASARVLKATAYPIATGTYEADRTAWDFRPGTPFQLNWPPLGISGVVCRVLTAEEGTLTDGRIVLEIWEDVFGVTYSAYSPPPKTGWTDPAGTVPALTAIEAFAAPLPAVEDLTPPPADQSRAVTMAARGAGGVTKGVRVYSKIGGVWSPALTVTQLTPTGILDANVDELGTSIVVQDGIDTDLIETVSDSDFAGGLNAIWIGGEIIVFKTVTVGAGTITLSDIARGCIDTVPMSHLAGARVWFLSYGQGLIGIQDFAGGPDTDVRFQAFNNRGEIAFASAPDDIATATDPDRALLPYTPTDFKVNGASYPDPITGEMTVSWEHRDRLAEWSYADSGKTAVQETSVVYKITVWGELDTIVHTELGLTGKSWTYATASEIAESGLGRLNDHLKVRLEAYRGADFALFAIVWEFDRV